MRTAENAPLRRDAAVIAPAAGTPDPFCPADGGICE